MIRLAPLKRGDTTRGALHTYPDGRQSLGLVNLWRGPTGDLLVLENMEWLGTCPAMRIHSIRAERVREWVTNSQPATGQFRTLADWPLDRASTNDDQMTDYDKPNIRDFWGNINRRLEDGQIRAVWNSSGSRAVLSRLDLGQPYHVLVAKGGGTMVLPKGYNFVDFTLDGNGLLVVMSQQIADPTADPKQKVLAKIDLRSLSG